MTQSFSSRMMDRETLDEVVSAHAARLSEKLRRDGLGTNQVTVFYHTREHDRGDTMRTVSTFMTLPGSQNAAWCRLLDAVENEPKVLRSHRDFLLMQDLTGVAAIALVAFGGIALVLAPTWKGAGFYDLGLAAQCLLLGQAASNYGNRFVCTVMASRLSKPARAKA